jgi:2,3-dihydroxybenzoate decarboxylase
MNGRRRTFIRNAALLGVAAKAGLVQNRAAHGAAEERRAFRRIAIEEAFGVPELFDAYREVLAAGAPGESGFKSVYGVLMAERPGANLTMQRLTDLGEQRIRDMDADGIAVQILSLVAPGVQVLDAGRAVDLAKLSNDRLAGAIEMYPDRFAGLAAFAPQRPDAAVRELERGVKTLGLRGAIVNSHTGGEFLDEQKFWPIFEAIEALDVPVYLHPQTPPDSMIAPYFAYSLESSIWGFAAESSLHALRLIFSGLFDRFARLKIILGHMGEGLPFWLSRLDNRYAWFKQFDTTGRVKQLQKAPSEYFKDNFLITTSGVSWHPALVFAHEVLGADNILFAVDYPFEAGKPAVEFMDTAPIPDGDKEKIYHLNAERMFRL